MDLFQIEALLREQDTGGKAWLPFLDIDSLTVGLYRVRESDEATHQPHPRDEVYYVLSGAGVIRVEGVDQAVGPGAVLFVPAHQRHHYHSITEELSLLVFFSSAPPHAG